MKFDVTRADCETAAAVLRDEDGHIWDASANERVATLLDQLASGERYAELKGTRAALNEAHMLLETAEQDGYVSAGWREDARTWASCWGDLFVVPSLVERPQ